MATITIPKEYGYVLATTAASFLVSVWHGMRVGPMRKAAKIPYPNCYASAESIAAAVDAEEKKAKYLFNCAQRAHANFLENYPIALAGMLASGLAYPVASAVTGAVFLVSRVTYAIGYTDPNKINGKGRYFYGVGSLFWMCELVWVGLLAKAGFDLIAN